MAMQLTITEVFDVAIRIEKDGAAFYRAAAMMSASPDCRKTLQELARLEADHELVFLAMKDRLRAGAGPAGEACPIDWTMMVQLFASDALKDLAANFHGRHAPEHIYRAAIDFEKDTIAFFLGLKRMLPAPEDQARIDELVREELGHLLLLSGKLAEALAPPGGAGLPDSPGLDVPSA